MIGFGTQDTRQDAIDFVGEFGTSSFTMLWDESFVSWTEFGITGQPTFVLLAPDGTELGRWRGPLAEDEILSLAASV